MVCLQIFLIFHSHFLKLSSLPLFWPSVYIELLSMEHFMSISINRHIPIATPQGFSKMEITWLVYQGELKFMHVNSEYLTAQKIAYTS